MVRYRTGLVLCLAAFIQPATSSLADPNVSKNVASNGTKIEAENDAVQNQSNVDISDQHATQYKFKREEKVFEKEAHEIQEKGATLPKQDSHEMLNERSKPTIEEDIVDLDETDGSSLIEEEYTIKIAYRSNQPREDMERTALGNLGNMDSAELRANSSGVTNDDEGEQDEKAIESSDILDNKKSPELDSTTQTKSEAIEVSNSTTSIKGDDKEPAKPDQLRTSVHSIENEKEVGMEDIMRAQTSLDDGEEEPTKILQNGTTIQSDSEKSEPFTTDEAKALGEEIEAQITSDQFKALGEEIDQITDQVKAFGEEIKAQITDQEKPLIEGKNDAKTEISSIPLVDEKNMTQETDQTDLLRGEENDAEVSNSSKPLSEEKGVIQETDQTKVLGEDESEEHKPNQTNAIHDVETANADQAQDQIRLNDQEKAPAKIHQSDSVTRLDEGGSSSSESNATQGLAENDKTKAPEGSLASFFEKVSAKSAPLGGVQTDPIKPIESTASTIAGKTKLEPKQPEEKESTNEPLYIGIWGRKHESRRPADLDLLYLVFKERLQNDTDFGDKRVARFPLSMGTEDTVLVDSVPPLDEIDVVAQINSTDVKSVNSEFIEGIDDIDKFFEGVDPPDELDVGAGGLSLQEIISSKGKEILFKRIALGLKFVRKVLTKLSDPEHASQMKRQMQAAWTRLLAQFKAVGLWLSSMGETTEDTTTSADGRSEEKEGGIARIYESAMSFIKELYSKLDDLFSRIFVGGDETDDDGSFDPEELRKKFNVYQPS